MKRKKSAKKLPTVKISGADLSFAIDSLSPSVLDGVGNALFKKLWRKLQHVQGKCHWNHNVLDRTDGASGRAKLDSE